MDFSQFLPVLLLTIVVVGVCILLLAIRIVLKKNGRFPNLHVGGNKALNQQGIHCAQTQDFEERHRTRPVSETKREPTSNR